MKRTTILACLIGLVAFGACSDTSQGNDPELTEPYHCGYGFYLGDADQSWGLKVTFEDFEAAQAGEIPELSSLPEGGWSADSEEGRDLFANWCDDVLEPDEPTPEVTRTWEVRGEIEIIDLPDAGECGPARATLSELEARNSDGAVISLGDFEVENDYWGCFAG